MRLIYNIILAFIGFGVIIVEFFVPAAGVIGIIGGGLVITGIVFTFLNYGLLAGTIFLTACALIGPLIIALYFKIFPKSFIGKKLILDKDSPVTDDLSELKGKTGVTLTRLRPAGYAKIDKKRYSVVTTGDFIDKDREISIIQIEGNKVVVSLKE